jgi:pimeloyl-ACP methyl ester carboxylesterase
MKSKGHFLSRRSVVAGALLAPAAALAKTPAKTAPSAKLWSNEYWAQKGDVKLYMFRKRAAAPKAGEDPLPVLLLVHGSSNSGRVSFDLATPGRGEYSVMNEFARLGFDTWTLDHENYGRSSQTQGNSDIASGVEDLKAAVELVARPGGRKSTSLASPPARFERELTRQPGRSGWIAWYWEPSRTRATTRPH